VPARAYLLFAALHLAGAGFRTMRFRLLLRASGETNTPGFSRILLVTGVRNMMVDFVPARLGELAYVGMLTRGYRVKLHTCLSSLAISVWLDIFVLVPVLFIFVAVIGPQDQARALVVVVLAVLILVSFLGYFVLFHGIWRLRALAERAVAAGGGRFHLRRVTALLASLSKAVEHTRDWRILGRGLLLSVGVRVCKYTGLLVLFLAIAQSADNSLRQVNPLAVLAALVASEAAASLPIPAFMSFGTYEAGGVAAFAALGFPAADAASVTLTTHAATQLLDYGAGLVCLALYFLSVRALKKR
jgi:uncharacterized membrane protein YbhN (UPF0104 family)